MNTLRLASLPIIVLALSSCATPGNPSEQSPLPKELSSQAETLHMDYAGDQRSYLLYEPADLPDGAPLVFVIHGFTDNARSMMYSTEMNYVAEQHGFAVCYPQGLPDDDGNTYWEVGYSFTEHIDRDDVGFLSALAAELQSVRGCSAENTFATGMSNGGEMSVMLGLFAPDVFSVIAPVAACIMDKTWMQVDATPGVPALFIHGDADRTTLWDGDMADAGGWGPYRPVEEMIGLFAGDGYEATVAELPDTYLGDGTSIEATTYTYKGSDRQVWFYKVIGGGHDWPGRGGVGDIHTGQEIWRFFSQYVK